MLPGRRIGGGGHMGGIGGKKVPLSQDYRANSYPSAVSSAKEW